MHIQTHDRQSIAIAPGQVARRDVQKMEDPSEPLSACDLHELLLAHSPEGAVYRYGGNVECTPGAWCLERCAARTHLSARLESHRVDRGLQLARQQEGRQSRM